LTDPSLFKQSSCGGFTLQSLPRLSSDSSVWIRRLLPDREEEDCERTKEGLAGEEERRRGIDNSVELEAVLSLIELNNIHLITPSCTLVSTLS